MERNYKLIPDEIPVKGIGYLILKESSDLAEGVSDLLDMGATQIFATGPLTEGSEDGLTVTHAHDMLRMERALSEVPTPTGRLTLEPLRPAAGGRYLAIYNECFFHVPNGATQTIAALPRLLGPGVAAGTVLLGDQPVGIYELDETGEMPEIAAVGILKTWRGKGLGRELILRVLAELQGDYPRCFLRVSTGNQKAFSLYRQLGFTVAERLAVWCEVRRG